jgi:hypothetical protein
LSCNAGFALRAVHNASTPVAARISLLPSQPQQSHPAMRNPPVVLLGLVGLAASQARGAAANPGNAFEALNNQETTVVASVAADQTFVEISEGAGDYLAQGRSASSLYWFTPFLPFDQHMSSVQANFGYASNPNQDASDAAAPFTNVTATLFQLQAYTPSTFGRPVNPEFIFADIGNAKIFYGNPSAKDKLSNKLAAVLKTTGGGWNPALYALYTYSGFKNAWDSRPELRTTQTVAGNPWQNWHSGMVAYSLAPFFDGYEDHKIVPAGSAPGNPDSDQWSAGTTLTLTAGPVAYGGSGTWRLDETAAGVKNNAETVTQSYDGWQSITALQAPAIVSGTPQLSFEYDGNDYNKGPGPARSAKRTLSLTMNWKIAGKKQSASVVNVIFGISPIWQGVDNAVATRKVAAFDDTEGYVAISVNNSASYFLKNPAGALRYPRY